MKINAPVALFVASLTASPGLSATDEERVDTRQYPGARSVVQEVGRREQLGTKVGDFWVHPNLLFSSYFDDNIFATNDSEFEDYVFIVSPTVRAHSGWDQHALNVELGADVARYARRGSENHEHYRAIVEGRFDVSTTSTVFGGVRYYRDTEDRESPDDVFGRAPTSYNDIGAYAGSFNQYGHLGIRVGGTWQQLNFSNALSVLPDGTVLGPINNDDRDRNLFTAGTHLSYLFAPGRIGFIQVAGDFRRYRQPVDDFNFDRDSDGYRIMVGSNLAWGGVVEAEIFGGYMEQSYDDPTFKSVQKPTFGLVVDWFVTEIATLSAYADRTLAETTAFASPGFLNSIVGLQGNYEFSNRLSAGFRLGYTRSEFLQIARDEDFMFVGFSGRFLIDRHFYCQADYQFRNLDSNLPDYDFARNQFYLRLGANF